MFLRQIEALCCQFAARHPAQRFKHLRRDAVRRAVRLDELSASREVVAGNGGANVFDDLGGSGESRERDKREELHGYLFPEDNNCLRVVACLKQEMSCRERVSFPSEGERLQIGTEIISQVVPLQGELDSGFQKAEFVAGVVSFSFEAVTVDGTAAQDMFQAVG